MEVWKVRYILPHKFTLCSISHSSNASGSSSLDPKISNILRVILRKRKREPSPHEKTFWILYIWKVPRPRVCSHPVYRNKQHNHSKPRVPWKLPFKTCEIHLSNTESAKPRAKSTQHLGTKSFMLLTSIARYYDRQKSVLKLPQQGLVPWRYFWERRDHLAHEGHEATRLIVQQLVRQDWDDSYLVRLDNKAMCTYDLEVSFFWT